MLLLLLLLMMMMMLGSKILRKILFLFLMLVSFLFGLSRLESHDNSASPEMNLIWRNLHLVIILSLLLPFSLSLSLSVFLFLFLWTRG